MAYRAYKKYNKYKNHEVNNTYKVKNLKNYTSKDNIFVFEKPEAQYLYVKPKYFQNSLMSDEMQRLKAGGAWQEEIYYDCQTSSGEDIANTTSPPGQNQIKQRHLRMSEVFNKVENPKEFKGALKQMARNSNLLYHSFRQAYHKTKKSSKSSDKKHENKPKYCLKCGGEVSFSPVEEQKDRGDMNPLKVENVDMPCVIRCDLYKQEEPKSQYQSDATHDKDMAHDKPVTVDQQRVCSKCNRSFDKDSAKIQKQHADEQEKLSCVCNYLDGANPQHITSKYTRSFDSAKWTSQHTNQQDKLSCLCASLSNFDPAGERHICSKYTRSVEMQIANQPTNQTAPSWLPPDPPCLVETNICSQQEDELQGLSFCERCAILKGEIPHPKKMLMDVNSMSSRNVTDNASQTYQMNELVHGECQTEHFEANRNTQPNQSNVNKCPCRTNYNPSQQVKIEKAPATSQPNEKKCSCRTTGNTNAAMINKHTLNIRPVYVTIPLKVQIDSPDGDTSFMETEIIMEASSGRQQQNFVQKINVVPADKSPAVKSPAEKSPTAKSPDFRQKISDFDLFYSCLSASGIIEPEPTTTAAAKNANYVPPCMANRKPQIAEITQTANGIEGTAIISTTITSGPQTSRRDYVRSDMPTDVNIALIAMPQTKLDDLKTKAERLRAELVLETKTALEHNGPEQAMIALQEKKHYPQAMDTFTGARLPAPEPAPVSTQPFVDTKMALERYSPPEAMLESRGRIPTDDYPLAASLPGTSPTILPSVSKQQEPIAFDVTLKKESEQNIILKQNLQPITDAVQTNITTIKPFGHYRRNEMRLQIQEQLNELLHPNSSNHKQKYSRKDRDAIISDLHKLFHPKSTGTFKNDLTEENVLYDIRYIMEPETQEGSPPLTPKPTESQESILESLKYILNPKSTQKDKAKKRKKYNKDTKERILEDLQIILKLRNDIYPADQEERDNILKDLRFMLDIGEEMTSPGRPQRAPTAQQGPTTSQALEARQQRLQRPMNEIRDSLISDLRYMLDAPQSGEEHGGDTSKK